MIIPGPETKSPRESALVIAEIKSRKDSTLTIPSKNVMNARSSISSLVTKKEFDQSTLKQRM